MSEEVRGRGRSPERPEKYVTLLELKERWMKQQEEKKREEERGEQGKVRTKLGELKVEVKEEVVVGGVQQRGENVARDLDVVRKRAKLGRPVAGVGVLNGDLDVRKQALELESEVVGMSRDGEVVKSNPQSGSEPRLKSGNLENGGGTEARILEASELEGKESGEGHEVVDCAKNVKKKKKKKRNPKKKLEMRMEVAEEVTEGQEKIEAIRPARDNGVSRGVAEVVSEKMEEKATMLSEKDIRRMVNRDGSRMKWQPRLNQVKAVGGVEDRILEPVKREAVPVNGFSKTVVYQGGNDTVELKQENVKSVEYSVDLREKFANSAGIEWDSGSTSSRDKFRGVRNKGSGRKWYGRGTRFEDEKKLDYVIVEQVKKEAMEVNSDNPRMASLNELPRKSASVIMSHETVEPVDNYLIENKKSGTPSVNEQPDGRNWFRGERNRIEGRKMYAGGQLETEKNVVLLNVDEVKKEATLVNDEHPKKNHNPSVEYEEMTESPAVAGKEANCSGHDRFRAFENGVEGRKLYGGNLYSGGRFKAERHLCSSNVEEVEKEATHMNEDQLRKNNSVIIKAETVEPVDRPSVVIKEAAETPAIPEREANNIDQSRAQRKKVEGRKMYSDDRLKVVRNESMDPHKFVDKGNRMRRLENQSFAWVKKGEVSSGNAGGKK